MKDGISSEFCSSKMFFSTEQENDGYSKEIELELNTRKDKSRKLILRSIYDDTDIEYGWSNPLNIGPTKGEYVSPSDILGEKTPLYFKNQGTKLKFYWFEHLRNERTIYFRFTKLIDLCIILYH